MTFYPPESSARSPAGTERRPFAGRLRPEADHTLDDDPLAVVVMALDGVGGAVARSVVASR